MNVSELESFIAELNKDACIKIKLPNGVFLDIKDIEGDSQTVIITLESVE